MIKKENILVIDDKPDNLRLLSNILTEAGYKVRKVLNGRLAIDAAQLDPPDLILLDIMMPETDGYQVCQSLKQSRQTEDIPIIFLSALDTVANKVKAFTMGGVDYITKPFQQEEVLARVKTHLQLRQLNRSLQQRNTLLKQEVKRRKKIAAELKTTLQELQAAQAQILIQEKVASLGTLTAGIAHELQNPLNFVNHSAESSIELVADTRTVIETQAAQLAPELLELLRERLADIQENARAIHQHGQRAEQIIHNMMQPTQKLSNRQWVNLNTLLAEATDVVSQRWRVKLPEFNITIHTEYDPALVSIEASLSDLSRAFINLIDNACYAVYYKQRQANATFEPTIWIRTHQRDHQIKVQIQDNGVGIAPDTQQQIFDPFFTTKANEGTGLGLFIAHDVIVAQHQGTLTVRSEINEYTEFTALFPA
ncbi:MAG: response regulator [Cyanobacteria bacterium RM1_2_2]|nr:response regulator [Cyanobacteria bacterium RM1_2_2]